MAAAFSSSPLAAAEHEKMKWDEPADDDDNDDENKTKPNVC